MSTTKGTRKRVWTEAVKGAKKQQKVWKAEVKSRGRFASGSGPELKFFDTANTFTFDSTGEVPATGQLSLIRQGAGESQRIGRKCVVKSIFIRGRVTLTPGAGAVAATTVYLYVVQDTQCNGAAAGATDVLTSTAFNSAFRNLDNSERFKILKRFTVTLNVTAGVTTAYNNMTQAIEWYGKCSIPLEFGADTGAVSDLRTNNIFFLAGSDGQQDDTVDFLGATRLRFSDGS